MPTARLGRVRIAYDDVGAGDAVLVLIHGHPFDRSMWAPQIEMLRGSAWRVVAPDLRGYGASSVVPGKTTLDVFARDVASLLDELGVHAAVIGGLSMGGQIAMEFCRLFPGRVRGLVLAATSPKAETEDGKRARTAAADRVLREGMDRYAVELLPKMLSRETIAMRPDVTTHVLAMMGAAPAEGAAAALRGRAERPHYEGTLAAVKVPALVVAGDEDPFTSRAEAERMHALLERSELVWFRGAGHMPNLERASEFNEALGRLLGRVADFDPSAKRRPEQRPG